MPTTTTTTQKHLVLVHGYCVSAVDLGGSGVHPSRLEEIATFADYIQPLLQFLDSLSTDERVVLVGHSYAGLAISLAMERFPQIVSVAVFITAYMPNYMDPPYFKSLKPEMYMDCRFTFKNGSPTSAELGDSYLATMMYQNCQPEVRSTLYVIM
ncbi:putative alpha/beta hydrolase-1 [Helianthus anomalus]